MKYREFAENTNAATVLRVVITLRLSTTKLNSVKRAFARFAVPVKASQSGGRIKHYEQAKSV